MQAVLEFFADDAEWTLAPGTFSGKDGIRRYLEWDMRTSPEATYRLTGIGVLTAGNVAVRETVVEQGVLQRGCVRQVALHRGREPR